MTACPYVQDEQLHRGEHLMGGLGRLIHEVELYLECVDVARTDPLDLAMGFGAPTMLSSYPALEGVHAYRRGNGGGSLGMVRRYVDAAHALLGPNDSPS